MIRAILYDLDGVLVDACDMHYRALNRALVDISGDVIATSEHESTFNGLPTKTKLAMLLQSNRIRSEDVDVISTLKQFYTRDSFETLTFDAEKVRLHQEITRLDIVTACVTNSIRSSAEIMLQRTGQLEWLDLLVSSNDVVHPKPSSEGYVTAMVELRTVPRDVLIIEDSEKGLIAARATGAHVLQVKNATEVTWENLQRYL